jgi:hypothetical protein
MLNSREDKFSHSTESEPAHTKFGQAAHQIEPERDLEHYIETLRQLDGRRKHSAKLHDYGIDVFKLWLKSNPTKAKPFSKDTASRYARAIEYLYHRSTLPPDGLDRLFKKLEVFINKNANLSGSSVLWTIKDDELPVLFAAQILQAFLSVPGRLYTKPALLCYY